MQYIVCYDISDDRRRSRAALALLDFGARIQESVFVAHLDEELAERMRERLSRVVDPDQDRVHVFGICEACSKRVCTMGGAPVERDPEWYVV